jgi:hypothetical protein
MNKHYNTEKVPAGFKLRSWRRNWEPKKTLFTVADRNAFRKFINSSVLHVRLSRMVSVE